MSRLRSPIRFFLFLLGGLTTWLVSGCGDGDRVSYATEADEPFYREGVALEKTGRDQEALSAFLKVIDKRGDDAPESHLEAGLLYQQHINDPLSAIYHFRRYLAIRPNSTQAPLIKQRIDSAVREFARTLPAQPLENQFQRVDLIAAMDKLKLENDVLKQQLADLKAGRDVPDASTDAAGQAADDLKVSLNTENIPVVRTHPVRPEPAAPIAPPVVRHATNQSPARTVATTPSPAPVQPAGVHGAPRKHTVTKGDTLSNLAQRYYNNRARWHEIYNANRKLMKNEGDLRPGMDLVIP